MIDVDHRDGECVAVPRGTTAEKLEALIERVAVEQSGEWVMGGPLAILTQRGPKVHMLAADSISL